MHTPAEEAIDRHATDGGIDLSDVPFTELVREQLRRIGLDPASAPLAGTPRRVEKALFWLTRGYRTTVEEAIGSGVFAEEHDNMIMVRDIELYSMCEHHMLPFFGKAHVAYIANGRLLGLSKVARVVEVFARRLQVQERLTDQIADAIQNALEPDGVGVVIEATHLCMMMRGVEKQNTFAITSSLRGAFEADSKTRAEFMELIRHRKESFA